MVKQAQLHRISGGGGRGLGLGRRPPGLVFQQQIAKPIDSSRPAGLQHRAAGGFRDQRWPHQALARLQAGARHHGHGLPTHSGDVHWRGGPWPRLQSRSHWTGACALAGRRQRPLGLDALHHQPGSSGRAIAKALLMGLSKGLLQLRGASAHRPSQQQALLMGLITQFQAPLGAAAALLLNPVLQLLEQLGAERFTHSALLPAALLGLANAPGREHPSEGMQQHPPQPQGFGQAAGQLAASTAIGNQHPAADVVTAKQRHLLNRRGHGLHGQIQRALGQGLNAAPQRCRQLGKALLHHRQIRRLIPLGTKHRRKLGHLQAPQQQMGIGEAKRPAPPVTSRPWISTSGTGPHLQALLLGAEDRATTGGNRMNRQPRCQQREAGNLGLRTALHIRKANTRWHAKDIGGGAAHVEPHQGPIGHTSPLRRRHRSHHAAGGPRQDRVLRQQGRRVEQSSAGSHHAQSGGFP